MMTDKYYDIYFEPSDLEVDIEGHLENPEVLQIIEFEYDDETEKVTGCRRVNENGKIIEESPDLTDLDHSGFGDDDTIGEALGRFEGWLNANLEWREYRRQTYWHPAEYICVGVSGCVDDQDYRER